MKLLGYEAGVIVLILALPAIASGLIARFAKKRKFVLWLFHRPRDYPGGLAAACTASAHIAESASCAPDPARLDHRADCGAAAAKGNR